MVDCSFLSALFLNEDHSDSVEAFFENTTHILWAPSLLWNEIGNVLTVSVWRKRLSHQNVFEIINLLETLNIQPVCSDKSPLLKEVIELALQYQLSAYDAAYLAVSLEKNAAIATFDQDLARAAKQAGIRTIEI